MFRLAIGVLVGCAWIVAYVRACAEDWWWSSSPRKRASDVLQVVGIVIVIATVLL